jgi:hypothetical protein
VRRAALEQKVVGEDCMSDSWRARESRIKALEEDRVGERWEKGVERGVERGGKCPNTARESRSLDSMCVGGLCSALNR